MKIKIENNHYEVERSMIFELLEKFHREQEINININGMIFKGKITTIKWKCKGNSHMIEKLIIEIDD